jgi:hypothetical protein
MGFLVDKVAKGQLSPSILVKLLRGMEKTTQGGALCSALLTKYYSGDQVRKNEMGGACSTYGGTGEVRTGF